MSQYELVQWQNMQQARFISRSISASLRAARLENLEQMYAWCITQLGTLFPANCRTIVTFIVFEHVQKIEQRHFPFEFQFISQVNCGFSRTPFIFTVVSSIPKCLNSKRSTGFILLLSWMILRVNSLKDGPRLLMAGSVTR